MKPSVAKILKSDHLSVVSLLFPIVFGLLYLLVATDLIRHIPLRKFQQVSENPNGAAIFLWILLIGVLIFVPLLGYRIAEIFSRFSDAVETEAEILKISKFRDRGTIVFKFFFKNAEHQVSSAVHLSKAVKELEVGQKVVVAVPRENPKKALIKSLYC